MRYRIWDLRYGIWAVLYVLCVSAVNLHADSWSETVFTNTGSTFTNTITTTGGADVCLYANDGAVTITSGTNLNTDVIAAGRAYADGVNFSVVDDASSGQNTVIINSATSNGLAPGDEIVIINLKGTGSNYTDVGKYEMHVITKIQNGTPAGKTTLTLGGNLTNSYLAASASQKIMVQRVPYYSDVTITAGGSLTCNAWDGAKGGLVLFRSSGNVNIQGSINVSQKGYVGGQAGFGYFGQNPTTGESYSGNSGGGAGTSSPVVAGTTGGGGGLSYNASSGFGYYPNYSGGGGGGGYGGVGIGATGSGGGSQAGSNGTSGAFFNLGGNGGAGSGSPSFSYVGGGGGGGAYSDAQLSQIFLGSGGGGGGGGNTYTTSWQGYWGAAGGTGGGIIIIICTGATSSITVSGTIQSNAGNGGNAPGSYSAGGGGGAGGSILLKAISLNIGANLLTALGGGGGSGNSGGGSGGAGGSGRIALNGTVAGTSNPAYGTTSLTVPRETVFGSSGTYLTAPINPYGLSSWGVLTYTVTVPANTTLTIDVLKAENNAVYAANITSGIDLSTCVPKYTQIKLRANFSSNDISQTPKLADWGIAYTGGGTTITTINWTSLITPGQQVAMGNAIAQAKFTMNTVSGTAHWKRFRVDKYARAGQALIPDDKIVVQVWMENNGDGFFDAGDQMLVQGTFTNNICYLNMNRWPVTTAPKTYYIVYKYDANCGGGQFAGVNITDSSYLEFEEGLCVGVPP